MNFLTELADTIKGIGKILLLSRPTTLRRIQDAEVPFIVMGNGPSLSKVIAEHSPLLAQTPSMSVNFAANAPEFRELKPKYYLLADPHFFTTSDPNVSRLWENINSVDWLMTLILPARDMKKACITNPLVKIVTFNPVGVEGFGWFERAAYKSGLAMPRPRNVLIPAIMSAIRLGYKEIYITGADHSWMSTIRVDEQNRVVTVQPHFYKDNQEEHERVASVYSTLPLHSVVKSFYIAFKAYHTIERFARSLGVHIYNATPGSMIDAFQRKNLPQN